jgi:hypothetical protein
MAVETDIKTKMSDEKDIIEVKLDGLKELIELKFDTNEKSHQAIIEQTTRTNGRVNKAEDRLGCLESWQNQLRGVWKLLVFVGFANFVAMAVFIAKVLIRQ